MTSHGMDKLSIPSDSTLEHCDTLAEYIFMIIRAQSHLVISSGQHLHPMALDQSDLWLPAAKVELHQQKSKDKTCTRQVGTRETGPWRMRIC